MWLWEKTEIHKRSYKPDLKSPQHVPPPPRSKGSGEERRGGERTWRTSIDGDGGVARIHRDPMGNPISMEYIKIGSVAYWRANCSIIDVSPFYSRLQSMWSGQCNGTMCTEGKKEESGQT